MTTAALFLALDLGTTSLAGRLLAGDGAVLAEIRHDNPQRVHGADVIRRLEAALEGRGDELRRLLVEGIEALTVALLTAAGEPRSAIVAAAAAANPAVTTLLLSGDPRPILFPPHRPADRAGRAVDPASLGLDLPVPLWLFPLVSGYVGGDLVAFLYGQAAGEASAPTLYIDIGTNAEIAYRSAAGWLTTSVAAGPAFEGGGISCGMAATPGAIHGVRCAGERLRLEVVGGGRPRGLCGSGLVEAIATAREAGLLDGSGRLLDPAEVDSSLSRYLLPHRDGNALCLYRDAAGSVLLTQADVRAFQLAKGAIHGGVVALLQRVGAGPEAVGRVLVSGAFGLSLAPWALKSVAMLPPAMIEKTLFVAGGCLAGIGRMLPDPDGSRQVLELAGSLKPYPLSGTPAFERAFLAALDF